MHPNTGYQKALRARYKAEGRCYCGRAREDADKAWCRFCRTRSKTHSGRRIARYQEWVKAHPEQARLKARQQGLRWRHGLTLEQYEQMFSAQGNCCAICGSRESRSRSGHFPIDHDHATGRIRGILCQSCNTALGQLRESETILLACIEYLRLHRLRAV